MFEEGVGEKRAAPRAFDDGGPAEDDDQLPRALTFNHSPDPNSCMPRAAHAAMELSADECAAVARQGD